MLLEAIAKFVHLRLPVTPTESKYFNECESIYNQSLIVKNEFAVVLTLTTRKPPTIYIMILVLYNRDISLLSGGSDAQLLFYIVRLIRLFVTLRRSTLHPNNINVII